MSSSGVKACGARKPPIGGISINRQPTSVWRAAAAPGRSVSMINYTERIALLMRDVVSRTPALAFIDLREVLVFGRFGRPDAEGAFATCHCLTLPETEPGYYFWRDRV